MKVELHTQKGVVGEIVLRDGVAVSDDDTGQSVIASTSIVEAGNPPKPLRPDDGERYLRALPLCISGAYFWATLSD